MSLFDPQPNFVEHDTFLFAVLGLASVNEKWQALLLTSDIGAGQIDHAPIDHDPIVSNKDTALNVGEMDDDFVLAILGIFSLSARLQELLRDWTQGEGLTKEPSIPGSFGFDEIDDLLR